MKILLIEDNREIATNICEYFSLEGHTVIHKVDWESGLDRALEWWYDLLLLDLMLPHIDGYTIARKMQWKIHVPIIMITAKWSIDEKLEWFESWALDYIVKPFDLRELEARVNAISGRNDTKVTIDDMEFDFKNRVFAKKWEALHLPKTEYEIIKLLFENKHKVVSRTEIIEEIWWEEALFDSDGKLDVYISHLRNKLSKSIIITVKWVGYKFNSWS